MMGGSTFVQIPDLASARYLHSQYQPTQGVAATCSFGYIGMHTEMNNR